MTWADLREYAAFNRGFLDDMRAAQAAGRSVEDVVSAWTIPTKYVGYETLNRDRLRGNVQVVYDELAADAASSRP